MKYDWDKILTEIVFKTSRSGGPGGQNVNKTETKVELRWNVFSSEAFTELSKSLVLDIWKNKLDNEGNLIVTSVKTRSQLSNKEDAIQKLRKLLIKSFAVRKKRLESKPTKSSIRKRIETKKKTGVTKQNRKKIDPNAH